MKLIFDLDPLRVPVTGIGRYTLELAKGMRQKAEVEDLKYQFLLSWVPSPELLVDKYGGAGKQGGKADQYASLKTMAFKMIKAVARRYAGFLKGLRCLPYRDYVYHSPSYSLPNFVKHGAVTIHDMSMFRVPEFHPADRIAHQCRIIPDIVRRAKLVLTVSEFSRSEILDYFDIDPRRVVSVPLGVDPMFKPISEMPGTETVVASLGLDSQSYTLFVSTMEPRKNIERLIEVYSRLPEEVRKNVPLVLVGGSGWRSEAIHEKIKQAEAEGWLRYMAYVSEEVLPHLFANAKVFAFISLYEGFGLPVLEAMASGVPVLCSNAASLPEVGGDAVLYVDPLDDAQILAGLLRLLQDDSLCKALAEKGLERAKGFTWQKTVDATLLAYQTVACR